MENKENCVDCGIDRKYMTEIPWARYRKNSEGKYEDSIQCKPCKEKEVENKVKLFQDSEPDTEYTDEIVCPNCGTRHEQDSEDESFYVDGDHEFTCGYCSEIFQVSTSVSYSYSTYKIKNDEQSI